MTSTVSPERRPAVKGPKGTDRLTRARAIAARADRWIKARRKLDGRPYMVIEGSSGHLHQTTLLACTCTFREYARIYDGCSHMQAVGLWWAAYRDGLVERPRLSDDDWAFFDADEHRIADAADRLLEEYDRLPRPDDGAIDFDWAEVDRALEQGGEG